MKNNKEKELCTSMYGTYECRDPMHKDKGEFCAHCLFENMTWDQFQEMLKNPEDRNKKLWKMNIETRDGDLSGMFYATQRDIKKLIGKEINFGEVLGKYSEIKVELEERHIAVVTEDPKFLEEVQEKEIDLEIGYNPFEYYVCAICGKRLDLDTGKCKDCSKDCSKDCE